MLKITFGAKHLNVVSFWFMLYILVNIKTGKRGNAGIKHSESCCENEFTVSPVRSDGPES